MKARYLRVNKWTRYQHYKTRRPPWIKFYIELLDPENRLNQLPLATRFLFDRLLLLAAEYDNAIPNRPEFLGELLRMDAEDVREGIALLVKGRWLSETRTKRRASKPASKGASKFARTESETETESPSPLTGEFKCARCDNAYKSAQRLTEHLEDVHGIYDEPRPQLRAVEGGSAA